MGIHSGAKGPKRVMFVFSHGFGTDKTDRGLFTDIAAALGVKDSCVMLDYNKHDADTNQTTVPSLSKQAKQLKDTLDSIDEPINLICHSQGCLVAAKAGVKGLQSVLFLAPATITNSFLDKFEGRYTEDAKGSIVVQRADDSTTKVSSKFLDELYSLEPEKLYEEFAGTTLLTIIYAEEDTKKDRADMPRLKHKADINIMKDADHNFNGQARKRLIALFRALK